MTKLKINWHDPIIKADDVLQITPSDLSDFYAYASNFDKTNIYFVLLSSLCYYEEANDCVRAAHLAFLISFYLFTPLTPPGSAFLALYYINKAVSLNPLTEYKEWVELIKRGN